MIEKALSYEECHKEINGIIHKLCSICKEWFPENLDNFYKKKNQLSPYCKECEKKKNTIWKNNNRDKRKIYSKREYMKEGVKEKHLETSKRRRENGEQLKWQQNNPEKIKQYRLKREQHKKHTISKKEWMNCKRYFNDCCAYCGLPLEEHYNRYRGEFKLTDFHKEHVEHNGTNDLSNCIPSCKTCNSSKHTDKLEDWYTEEKEFFSQERLDNIHKWLNEDYKLYIKEFKSNKDSIHIEKIELDS